jgi:hypothetical protein
LLHYAQKNPDKKTSTWDRVQALAKTDNDKSFNEQQQAFDQMMRKFK